ncbi:MAG: T9SS type A sorting domain-containing protein [Bacteroidota bacterium]
MKQLLLLLTILLTTNSVLGQNLNFPDSNAIWSVYNEKYFVKGDSTYNGSVYKKYYFTNDSIVTTGSFFALLREDTILKKVFSIPAGSTQEHLLYDFSLALNDTISVYPLSFPFYSGPILIKVDLIDSILLGSNFYKRLKISGVNQNTGYNEYWIEGIGSTMGLFNSGITGIMVFDIYYPTLLCFEKDGVTLYINPNFTSCYQNYPTGIDENSSWDRTLFFPNPANNRIYVESVYGITSYKIESLSGQILKQEMTNTTSFSIDISSLLNGIYLFTLTTDKGSITKKFIKIGLALSK